MARNKTDVVILGAGAVGLSCAYFLHRAGLSVQLLDSGKAGQGASLGNCGLITPGHAPPVCSPGAMKKALKWLFKDTAPLHVRPRLDPALAGWMLQFARNCDAKETSRIMAAKAALLTSSRDLTQKLIEKEKLDCEFSDTGLMSVCLTDQGLQDAEEVVALLQSVGIDASLVDGDQAREAEPALSSDVIGGAWFPQDATLRPDRFTSELNWALHNKGVALQEDCQIKAFNFGPSGRLESVFTDRGTYESEIFIAAAGVWTPRALEKLKMKIPIQAGMGYSLTTKRPEPCPAFPLLMQETHVVATPWASGYRLGGTMEFAGIDASPNPKRFLALIEGARDYLIEPLGKGQPEKWHGYRPMTPDDLPLIGTPAHIENLCFAAGHNMLGMSMAVGTGRLVAEMMTGRQTHIDPAPYSPGRFKGINPG
ncbi:MAG: FAD-dependent oxidoreductase [Xanthomonadales bacterium]|nr:FAD-dependent oxidoreductase [Xanthomonadales bacterium]